MGAVAAQYINLTPFLVYGLFFYVILPIGSCVIAGFLRTSNASGALRGALCGVLTAIASVMGCGVLSESTDFDNFNAFILQSSATAAVGAVVTYWAVRLGFWNN